MSRTSASSRINFRNRAHSNSPEAKRRRERSSAYCHMIEQLENRLLLSAPPGNWTINPQGGATPISPTDESNILHVEETGSFTSNVSTLGFNFVQAAGSTPAAQIELDGATLTNSTGETVSSVEFEVTSASQCAPEITGAFNVPGGFTSTPPSVPAASVTYSSSTDL